jgi:predicted TIM-barrel fold metal-dependent hydrolase
VDFTLRIAEFAAPVAAFGDWVSDDSMRRKISVDTPAAFYRFDGRLPMTARGVT